MATVIITKADESINTNEDWRYGIDVEVHKYKGVPDRYNVEIVARKRVFQNTSPVTTDEICIRRYNRTRETHIPALVDTDTQLDTILNKANTALQSLLRAIANGDPVWDAREET